MSQNQQGSGALIAVILLLMMSAALLHASRRQLDDSLRLVTDERLFFQQYSKAESALDWGSRLRWPVRDGWQCQNSTISGWRACLSGGSEARLLLRGDSGSGSIAHYQWMTRGGEPGTIRPAPHGWIDYCPLSDSGGCQPDE